jgi:deoxyribodipyrimidine photo-lyase
MMILWHFPHVEKSCFKPLYNNIPWRNDEDLFKAWCEGKTGFPIVDAGMRELSATGFMHNRVRMIVSSFLIKDLLINWQWGEAHFAKKLNDFDLSANNGGWQWAAGSGCDAAPYFRVFNPTEQQKKFDPQFIYIKKWVPEFGTDKYPTPVVDHAQARLRTLAVYKKSLIESRQAELF